MSQHDPKTQHDVRIVGARLIDGVSDRPVTNAEIVAVDGTIVYAGPRRQHGLHAHRNLPTLDLGGRTVLPGFVDCHIHVALELEDTMAHRVSDAGSYATLRTAERLRGTLNAGVTTIRDLGGLDHGFKRALADGLIAGPRAHIAVGVISPTGGHADCHLHNGGDAFGGTMNSSFLADTDDEIVRTVRTLLRSGADVIKVCTTGGVSSPTDQPDDLGVPQHQVALVRAELDRHSHYRSIAAHAQGAAGILAAIRGGVDSVEHGYAIDDQGIQEMLDRGTFLVPTLSSALRVPDPAKVPAYVYEKKVRWSEIAREHVARALKSGVRVALGTDSGVSPHGINLLELVHLVDLGLSPLEAIRAGTSSAAQLLGVADQIGTVEAGKLADLIVVSGDPLADISLLATPDNVELVIQGGAVVKGRHADFAATEDRRSA